MSNLDGVHLSIEEFVTRLEITRRE